MSEHLNTLEEFSEGLRNHIRNFLELKHQEQQYKIQQAGEANDYYMSVQELAAYLRLRSTLDIYKAVWDHSIPFVIINEIVHFPKKKIDKWLRTEKYLTVLPKAVPPEVEVVQDDTVIKMRAGTALHEKEITKGQLMGVASGIEINLRLDPDKKFRLDKEQIQKIEYDLFLISQNFLDFMDRFLGHYAEGGTVGGFEG